MSKGFFEESSGRCAEIPFVAMPVASQTFPLHYHREIEIYFVISGSIEFSIDDETITAHENDIVICMPWQCHGFVKNGEFMFVRTSVELGGDCRNLARLRPRSTVISSSVPGHGELVILLHEIIETNASRDPDRMFKLNSISNLLIYRMLKLLQFREMSGDELDTVGSRIEFVKKLEEYISDKYSKNITLSDAARHFCFSTGYFARCFKKYMKTTFVNYLTTYRASRAAELLVNTNLSVETIAESCGFVSYRNLNRAFDSLYGTAPSRYRRESKK
jgi:xylan 1,4-beta-xylosidase